MVTSRSSKHHPPVHGTQEGDERNAPIQEDCQKQNLLGVEPQLQHMSLGATSTFEQSEAEQLAALGASVRDSGAAAFQRSEWLGRRAPVTGRTSHPHHPEECGVRESGGRSSIPVTPAAVEVQDPAAVVSPRLPATSLRADGAAMNTFAPTDPEWKAEVKEHDVDDAEKNECILRSTGIGARRRRVGAGGARGAPTRQKGARVANA